MTKSCGSSDVSHWFSHSSGSVDWTPRSPLSNLETVSTWQHVGTAVAMVWLIKDEDWEYLRTLNACILPEHANKLGIQDLTTQVLAGLAIERDMAA